MVDKEIVYLDLSDRTQVDLNLFGAGWGEVCIIQMILAFDLGNLGGSDLIVDGGSVELRMRQQLQTPLIFLDDLLVLLRKWVVVYDLLHGESNVDFVLVQQH